MVFQIVGFPLLHAWHDVPPVLQTLSRNELCSTVRSTGTELQFAAEKSQRARGVCLARIVYVVLPRVSITVVDALTHATREVHHVLSEVLTEGEIHTSPKTRFWRELKVLPDDKSPD